MKLFPNESIVLESNDKTLTLTNHRVRFYEKTAGNIDLTSILLSQVSGCSYTKRSSVLYIVMAVLSLATAAYFISASESLAYSISLGVFLLFVIFYYITLRKHPVISSSGAKIQISAKKLKTDLIVDFVDKIEEIVASKQTV